MFNYFGETNNQIDLQRWRYYQQQQADALNNRALFRQSRNQNMQKREVAKAHEIYLIQKTPVNYGLNYDNNLKLLHESFGEQQEKDIEALNDLIGKAPSIQLAGLSQLLNPKDFTPITEHIVDIANPQSKPNIKVVHAPPEYQEAVAQIQVLEDAKKKAQQQNSLNHLNEVAQQQAEDIFIKTQQADLGQIENQDDQDLLITQTERSLQYASQYAFGYRVRDYRSGNDFGHEEISDGHTAKGQYHVLLPDGRLQNVQYWADDTGFHAKITYERLAQH
ncbi:hypothetical protein ILUMI_07998 [Ignelater luminosus]|uniref:Uncharacterized protein n=1 Tax=Ignelater luminosus TaxID=2038154 RepID=A0A8K0D2F6_IGNLU|nr:hypothetical protein ILUMI_07998 [Ignelater luminosus]